MIDQALYRALKKLNVAGVYAGMRGDNSPAVVYTLISAPRTITITAKPEIMETRLQIDCYSETYKSVKSMSNTIVQALHNQTRLDDVTVQRVLLEDQRDRYEQTSEIFGQMLQFVIYHYESGD